jgi:hypothetical protein
VFLPIAKIGNMLGLAIAGLLFAYHSAYILSLDKQSADKVISNKFDKSLLRHW